MKLEENITAFTYKTPIEIRFADMDMFGHANNAVYLTYFEQARSAYWKDIIAWDWKTTGIILVKSEVEYLKPILLEDKITACVKTTRVGNSSFDIAYLLYAEEGDNFILKTIGKTTQVAIDYKTGKPVAIPQAEKAKMIAYDNPEA
jgi:acyl-CoA thioester hydrolase